MQHFMLQYLAATCNGVSPRSFFLCTFAIRRLRCPLADVGVVVTIDADPDAGLFPAADATVVIVGVCNIDCCCGDLGES